jgi:integrase
MDAFSGAIIRGRRRRWRDQIFTDDYNFIDPTDRAVDAHAGVAFAAQYSSHSLQRGFAQWAMANGWDLKTLMEYVGWKSVQSALRYVESAPASLNFVCRTRDSLKLQRIHAVLDTCPSSND